MARAQPARDVLDIGVQLVVPNRERAASQTCFGAVHHGPQAAFVAGNVGAREAWRKVPFNRLLLGARQPR